MRLEYVLNVFWTILDAIVNSIGKGVQSHGEKENTQFDLLQLM
jgi:hypothetical protein